HRSRRAGRRRSTRAGRAAPTGRAASPRPPKPAAAGASSRPLAPRLLACRRCRFRLGHAVLLPPRQRRRALLALAAIDLPLVDDPLDFLLIGPHRVDVALQPRA